MAPGTFDPLSFCAPAQLQSFPQLSRGLHHKVSAVPGARYLPTCIAVHRTVRITEVHSILQVTYWMVPHSFLHVGARI